MKPYTYSSKEKHGDLQISECKERTPSQEFKNVIKSVDYLTDGKSRDRKSVQKLYNDLDKFRNNIKKETIYSKYKSKILLVIKEVKEVWKYGRKRKNLLPKRVPRKYKSKVSEWLDDKISKEANR